MERDLSLRDELERRYDGPVPTGRAELARWLSNPRDSRALAERAMWAAAVRNLIRSIRALRRVAGSTAHQGALERELGILRLYFRGANRAVQDLRNPRLAARDDQDAGGD